MDEPKNDATPANVLAAFLHMRGTTPPPVKLLSAQIQSPAALVLMQIPGLALPASMLPVSTRCLFLWGSPAIHYGVTWRLHRRIPVVGVLCADERTEHLPADGSGLLALLHLGRGTPSIWRGWDGGLPGPTVERIEDWPDIAARIGALVVEAGLRRPVVAGR